MDKLSTGIAVYARMVCSGMYIHNIVPDTPSLPAGYVADVKSLLNLMVYVCSRLAVVLLSSQSRQP